MDLRAEISGMVIDVLGERGVDVAEGDPVLILEAMKMEIPALAPCAGRIVEILVTKGEVVPQDHLLAVIAPA
jgi:biotin carboxyl carrier protein